MIKYVQYFLSMLNIPLTSGEYEAYPAINDSQFVVVSTTDTRMLVRGIINIDGPFGDILQFLESTGREPNVLMALNEDSSDYCPDGEKALFERRYEEYLAFFPMDADGNRSCQNSGGGWLLPGDVTETQELPE